MTEDDTVAYLLPSTHDTLITMLGGMTAGKVAPINSTLEPAHISALLRETGAKVLVTLKSFPKSDLTQQAHNAVAEAPNVKTVVEIDLLPNLSGVKKLIVPMVRPKVNVTHKAQVLDFHKELSNQPADCLTFTEKDEDRFCALFHTGCTTGMPKIAQHRHSGILYNGWMGSYSPFSPQDVLLCPLPQELYKRFVDATGVEIQEGYGMTEATCVVSSNPRYGKRRIGSVGYRMPYSKVRILNCDDAGNIRNEAAPGVIGEICVSSPGVMTRETYTDASRNDGLFADGDFLRTGDLGRIDEDGYIWITGRAKDLIIRGVHNVDPAMIEDGLSGHPSVAFVGAIGQPDEKAGELPCAYVELIEGATVTAAELMDYASKTISERAAHPKHLELLHELPKTAVGKVFKPALRKSAITRVYNAALTTAGVNARVREEVENKNWDWLPIS